MSPPEQRSGPQGTTPESRSNADQPAGTTTTHRLAARIVTVIAYAPDARARTRWSAVLETCPACRRPHLYYGTRDQAPSGTRSCHGQTFRLHPIYGGEASE